MPKKTIKIWARSVARPDQGWHVFANVSELVRYLGEETPPVQITTTQITRAVKARKARDGWEFAREEPSDCASTPAPKRKLALYFKSPRS